MQSREPRAIIVRMGAPAKFDLMRAAELIAEVQVKGAVTAIGRHPDNEVVVDDRSLSRFHARIEWRGGHYVVVDCGAQNGVILNGARVEGEAVLIAGDEMSLGRYVLVMRDDGPPPGDAAGDDDDTDPNISLDVTPKSFDLDSAKGGSAHPADMDEIKRWVDGDD